MKKPLLNEKICAAATQKILYLPHAIRQMNSPHRMISPEEIRDVIEHGEIIEDYPADPRGHSCLLFKQSEAERPIHVVCSPKEDYLAIITAYIPDEDGWEQAFRRRKQS